MGRGSRRGERRARFVLQCRSIYSSFDPVLTSTQLRRVFCRPFLNRQNRFRLHLNEWSNGWRSRRPTKSKVLEIFSRSRRSFVARKGGGERRRRRLREGASRTRVLHMYLPFHLSSLSAAEGWTDVGAGRPACKVASFSPFWR